MLSFEENRGNFRAIKIYSALNMLPIEIDLSTGKIQRQSSGIRIFLWKVLYAIGITHWLYILERLVQSVLEPEKYFQWYHFVIHSGFVVYIFVIMFIHFHLFVANPEEVVMVFNQLFKEEENVVQKIIDEEIQLQNRNQNGSRSQSQSQMDRRQKNEREVNSGSKQPSTYAKNMNKNRNGNWEQRDRVRPLFTWPLEYSVDELIARTYSMTNLMTQLLNTLIIGIDPTRFQLLYSALPSGSQNPSSYFALLLVEAALLTFIFGTYYFSTAVQLLFFSKCQSGFQRLFLQLGMLKERFQNCSGENGNGDRDRDIKIEMLILRQILKEMKELAVFIELFNRCFPFPIFALKMFCLSVSILFYFFTIRHAHDFPFPAFFTGYIASLLTLTYAVLYRHAFSVPTKMEQFKHEFLLTAQKTMTLADGNSNKSLKAEMKREIERIQNVGIKVGSFHTMERESTPNFVDFVVKNVVSLLVTFPR